jgi:hypothetical protein
MKRIDVDTNRNIEIYDDIFTASELFQFYEFAQQSAYRLVRNSTSLVEDKGLSTFKCDLTLTEMLKLGIYTSKNFRPFLKIVKDKNVRMQRSYINLCSSDDLFPYHTDSYDNNGLTMLYYMNTQWDPIWEGETHFANDSMTDLICSSAFIPGRLAVFTPTIPHKSSQPSSLARQFRFTFANKFHSINDGLWPRCYKLDDLIIPDDDEIEISKKEKDAIEALRPIACQVDHSGTDGFNHLYNTYKILKWNGLDPDTCLAGLFHCVYGTGSYNQLEPLKISRDTVQGIIGSRAESLVFEYKKCFPRTSLLDFSSNIPSMLRYRLLWISYANAIEQSYRVEKFAEEVLSHRIAIDAMNIQ